MNIQDFLTYLLDVIACGFGFISLIVLDLGDGLSSNVLNTFCPPATTPQGQKDIPLAAKIDVVEDPWTAPVEMC
jgi:hypothetical protein